MIFDIAERDENEDRAVDDAALGPTAPIITDPVILGQTAPVINDPPGLDQTAPATIEPAVFGPAAPVITDPLVLGQTGPGVTDPEVLGLPLPLDDDQIFHAEMERKFKYGKRGRKKAILHEDVNQPKKTMLCIFLYLWANTFAVSDPCHIF